MVLQLVLSAITPLLPLRLVAENVDHYRIINPNNNMMDSGVWWTPASVLLGCCLLVAAVYADRVYFARRRGVASAPTLPFIGSTWWTLMHKSRILHFVHEQFRAHGELVTFTGRWLGSPRYFFSASPAVVEHVLKTRFDNYVKGPLVRQNLNDLLGVGIFTVDGQQWKEQRKIASHMFSLREFRDTIFESVQRHCDSLDRILSALATNSDSPDTDFQSLFMRFTLDTIGDVAFGDDLGSLENPAVPFGRAFDGAQGIVEQRFVTPGWQFMELLTGSRFRLNAHVRVINTYCAELIAKRRDSLGESGARRDLLSRVMAMEDENGAALHLHDDAFLRDVIVSGAGSALSFFLRHGMRGLFSIFFPVPPHTRRYSPHIYLHVNTNGVFQYTYVRS